MRSNLACLKCIQANKGRRQRPDIVLQCFHGVCTVCGSEDILLESNFFSLKTNEMISHKESKSIKVENEKTNTFLANAKTK